MTMVERPDTVASAPEAEPRGDGPASRRLRQTLQAFATGVAVVSTTRADGSPVGMTVNSFTSVSLTPPIVLWCLRRESRSLSVFDDAEWFVVNILAADQEETARLFASRTDDRFARVPWRMGLAGQPVLDGVCAWLACRRTGVRPHIGDHAVFFGEVASHRRFEKSPLVFGEGGYGTITSL